MSVLCQYHVVLPFFEVSFETGVCTSSNFASLMNPRVLHIMPILQMRKLKKLKEVWLSHRHKIFGGCPRIHTQLYIKLTCWLCSYNLIPIYLPDLIYANPPRYPKINTSDAFLQSALLSICF